MKTGAIRRSAAAGALLALAACATTAPQVRLNERLDERTGITVTTLDRPLEFFSPLPEKGLEAASFADLGLAEANRMGVRTYYLWFSLLWGRLDPARVDVPGFSSLVINVGTESLTFREADRADPPSRVKLYPPPADWSAVMTFALTVEQVRAIAHASMPTLQVESGAGARFSFTLWKPPTETLPVFSDELLDGNFSSH